jgi:hypothetical protein
MAPPLSEAEAYVAQGVREIAEHLESLSRQVPRPRRSEVRRLLENVSEYRLVAAVAVMAGAAFAAMLAGRLIFRPR